MIQQPKFWKNKNIFSDILLPFSYVYIILGKIRNFFEKNYKSNLLVICVGNFTIGGSGKTPTVIYISNLLKKLNFNTVVLLKGYQGKLNGPIKIASDHNSIDAGDEAVLHSKMNETWISNNRYKAVKLIENRNKEKNLIIMDDGLQSQSVIKNLNIAVFNGNEGIGNGRIIPAGPMRESLLEGLKKIDLVIIIGEDKTNIATKIKKLKQNIKIFYAYFEGKPLIINKLKSKNIFAFAGIGFPSKFYNLLKNNNLKVIKTKDFPDHHKFNYGQLSELVKESQRCNADLVTTEKDYVKISEMNGIIKKYILPFPIKLKMENEKFFIDELKKFLDEKN